MCSDQIHDEVLVDYCDEGPVWDPILSAYFFQYDPATGNVTRLGPSGESTAIDATDMTSFFYFNGIWGDLKYPDSHPEQKTVPYFGLKRFTSGPTGPAHKHLVRKGLRPDKRRRKPWVEWGVGVFMSFYPCCIRGWRFVLSLLVMGCLLGLMLLTVKHGLKRYRMKRGYRKLNTDIPLNDLEMRERYD